MISIPKLLLLVSLLTPQPLALSVRSFAPSLSPRCVYNETILGPQSCFDKNHMFKDAEPVNATDLYQDAKNFCNSISHKFPTMRPRAMVRGNGHGAKSKQHFEIRWLDLCFWPDIKTMSLLDPFGNNEKPGKNGDDWCTHLLTEN
ncbi:uncharacterized protein CTRU02_209565 [Colletotrichum truncatum]|uniref:Uncharacterized protein n=1 Tax=Colletotrichum truncatum TaxID=5467 RepID=A0ACC3YSU5_COLTU|nr:uncharacterized protein CTRU02_14491 [Colletotrichum truncatum]KAF6782161.1 hypothetical protein CTRU02_14491 [Colletotrichum truncatum]